MNLKGIRRDFKLYQQNGLLHQKSDMHVGIWNRRMSRGGLADSEGEVNPAVFDNFRREFAFIDDNPRRPPSFLPKDSKEFEVEVTNAKFLLDTIDQVGAIDFLKKYPSPEAGNPYLYKFQSYGEQLSFTHRWIKHIYSIYLFDKFLKPEISKEFVSGDIGSCYGMFANLLHQEAPGCHQVLIDFPEQLLFARYFLQHSFPKAVIGGISEFEHLEIIDKTFLRRFDFILLPWQWLNRLESGSVDLFSSFACMGNFKRDMFNYYTKSQVFTSAKFYFLVEHVSGDFDKDGAFDNSEVSILDYEFVSKKNQIHFGYSPIYRLSYNYRQRFFPPFFEYIGRNDKSGI